MTEEKWVAWEIQTSRKWSDVEDILKYTNIDFIDHDHQLLVEYALKLNRVLDQSEIHLSMDLIHVTKDLLDDLFNYAKEHFEREEDFMKFYQLPEFENHKNEHELILVVLSEALENFKSGRIKLSKKLKTQVMDWLINHINVTDHAYFDIDNWSKNIINASDWEDIKPIIDLTGISEIDEQHQKLTIIALNALKKMAMNPDPPVIDVVCHGLSAYATYHFEFEASFMEKYKIHEKDKHIEAHSLFINKIAYYASEIKREPQQLANMKSWILTWWISHINSVDKNYFAYKNWAYLLIEQAQTIEDLNIVLRRTGIEEIDQDHLRLMGLTLNLNKLIELNDQNIKSGIDNQEVIQKINGVLDKTYEYAAAHFEREEKMMKEHHMTDLRRHSAAHGEILKRILEVKENYLAGRLCMSSNIKTMILEWWIEHTNTMDYRTFVQNFKREDQIRISKNV